MNVIPLVDDVSHTVQSPPGRAAVHLSTRVLAWTAILVSLFAFGLWQRVAGFRDGVHYGAVAALERCQPAQAVGWE